MPQASTRSGVQLHLTMMAALLAMVGPFTIDTYLPSFPDIEATFHVERAILVQSLGVYLAAFAVSTLFWGPLADRIGRRHVVIISSTLFVLASIGCAWADSMEHLLLLRLLQGLAASGGLIAGRAMIRDAHDAPTAQKAMAQVMLMFALAPAIAPILGGWLQEMWGWRSVFWFLALFGLLILFFTLFTQETLGKDERQSIQPRFVLNTYMRTLRHAQFPALVLSLSFIFAGLFLYIAGAPTLIYDFLGLGAQDFSIQFVPMVSGMLIGSVLAGRMAHRWSASHTIRIGFTLMATAVGINVLQSSLLPATPFFMIAPLALYALGLALLMPTLTILALDCFPHHRGTAASMQGFLQMVASALVASVAVPLLHSERFYFAMGQALFLCLAIALWWHVQHLVHTKQEGGEHGHVD